MLKEETVSIIVPVYNVGDYLSKCFEAITRLSYEYLEIIIIDDGSTDHSSVLCDSFSQKRSNVKVIHQSNQGLWAARNRGIEEATGEYIMFVDADDYFHKDIVSVLVQAINLNGKKYPLALCGATRSESQDLQNETLITPHPVVLTQEQLIERLFTNSNPNVHYGSSWSKLYRRCTLSSSFQREYIRGQDYDSNMRYFIQIEEAVLVPEIMYCWVIRLGQLTAAHNAWALRRECHVRMYYSNYKDLPDKAQKYSHYYLEGLWKNMVFYIGVSQDKDALQKAAATCHSIVNETRKDFLTCKEIPFGKRIVYYMMVRFSGLTRLLFRLTKNA